MSPDRLIDDLGMAIIEAEKMCAICGKGLEFEIFDDFSIELSCPEHGVRVRLGGV